MAFGSLGAILLLPTLAIGAALLVLRVRPASMLLVGAGLGIAVPWVLHITSGDTPDRELWPVFVGLAFVALGLFAFFTQKPGPDPAQATPGARSA